MTFTHVHDPSYLEPDPDDEDGPFSLDSETVAAAAEYLSLHPFTVEFFPYVTPLSEIPAALGGAKRA